MALNSDSSTALISQFRGSTPAQDSYDIDPSHALYCQNCDFFQGLNESVQVSTRRGFSLVSLFNILDGAILSLGSWYYSLLGVENCLAVYYSPLRGVRAWDQLTQTFSGLLGSVLLASSAVFAFDGTRLYMAYSGPSGRIGISGGEIFSAGPSGGGPDPLFPNAVDEGFITVLVGEANVVGQNNATVGDHNIVAFWTSRAGYFGPFLPLVPGSVATAGTAYSFSNATLTPGNNTLTWSLTVNSPLPSYFSGGTIQLAMTSASNPARYFLIPGASAPIPSTFASVVIPIGISDNDLVEQTDITQNQNYFGSQAANASPQFSPSALFQYSSRMGYVTVDSSGFPVVFFSQQNSYQTVSKPFGGIFLEGREIPVQGVSLGGTCYIATLSGLYGTQDNGDLPATWTPPSHIDGSVGILAPSCILSSGGKILIASEKGLFLFRGGSFPQLPISYFQDNDWNRINWRNPSQVQIVDDSYSKVIYVQAPLSVVIVAVSNTNPVVITTAVLMNNVPLLLPHLFPQGLVVTISGVQGTTSANGTFVISVLSETTFSIPVAGNGVYVPDSQGFSGTATPEAPNAILSWAYPGGDDLTQLFYSLNGFVAYRPGSMSTVRNISKGIDETWIAPYPFSGDSSSGLIRRVLPTDGLIHRDLTMGGAPVQIRSIYQTSNLPGSQDESITEHDFHGAHLRVSGQGSMALQVANLDASVTIVPVASPLSLSQRPGREILVKWFIRSEQETLIFSTNTLDAYFILALIRAYYTNSLPQK